MEDLGVDETFKKSWKKTACTGHIRLKAGARGVFLLKA